MKLNLTVDKLTFRGPKIDGSFVITLELGEYQKQVFGELVKELDMGAVVQVTIEQNEN